jgi:hypothetical protein
MENLLSKNVGANAVLVLVTLDKSSRDKRSWKEVISVIS